MKSNSDRVIKVCHIITADIWAGAEVQAYSLISGLNKLENIVVRVIVFNRGKLYSKVLNENINVDIVNEKDRNVLSMIFSTYRLLKKYQPDIVHTHGFKENIIGGIVAKALLAKAIRTHHGKGVINGNLLHRFIERLNGRYLTNWQISVSDDLKNYLIKKKVSNKKLIVIRNGANCLAFNSTRNKKNIREKYGIESDARLIGTVGRMVPVKNHKTLLDAAKTILNELDNTYFIIVGDGPLMDETKRYAKYLGIEQKVKLPGFQGDVIDYFNVFDIFVLPSLHEGIPISLLEAMCLEKPIVATHVGGVPEIIKDHYNGILVPPDNPTVLAQKCIQLLVDKQLRENLTNNAMKDMKQKYSLDKSIANTVKLYQEEI